MTLVFFGHFETLFHQYIPPDSYTSKLISYFAVWGHRGISFFFVITGYFVYSKFLDPQTAYLPFVKKRLVRILPLYWSVLATYLALSFVFPSQSKLPHERNGFSACLIENILLLPGVIGKEPIITVSWALSYLVLAYLLTPLLVRALKMSGRPGWERSFLIIAGALLWLVICKICPNLSARPLVMAVGMLLYEAVRNKSSISQLSKAGEAAAVCLLILGLTLWYLYNLHYLSFLPSITLPGFYPYLLLAPGLFYFSEYCFAYKGFLSGVLSQHGIRVLGRMSYSYYLCHGITLKGLCFAATLLFPGVRQSALLFWCALPVSYVVTLCGSAFVFATVEQPLADLNRGRETAQQLEPEKIQICGPRAAVSFE